MSPPESPLVRFVRGDDAAFPEVVASYAGPAYSVAIRVLQDQQRAEEAVQDAMMRVWERAPRSYVPGQGNERSWVMTIARNAAIDLQRKQRPPERSIDAPGYVYEEEGSDEVWESVVAKLTRQDVLTALGALPPDQRAVVFGAYYGGLRPVEIARQEGIPEGTVRSRLRLGLQRLRATLSGGGWK